MIGAFLALLALAPAGGNDELSVGVAAATPNVGSTLRVPVFARDVAGTTLDEGAGPDHEIQGFAFRVDFPPTYVSGVNFLQAGVTQGRNPVFPVISAAADHITVLLNFSETTDPLAFALDAAPPGDRIGELEFTLAAAPAGAYVSLALASSSATLVNDSATQSESSSNGSLTLHDGFIVFGDALFADGFE